MTKNKFIAEALTDFKHGIEKLEKVFESEHNIEEQPQPTTSVDTSLLANRMAYSYSTFHPEYRVDSQFKNLKDMVNSQKITIVMNWLRKNNIEGIEPLFQMDTVGQRLELNKALEQFETNIKEIFKQRFSC